ncbi:MAG: RagB/SusD family nutrient uptake outer membrane protein, partial [Bacteroidota bacterium]|nr:RagB/SusD family nutrient uptake outer membrane protein [Bacteroidota bacterium]
MKNKLLTLVASVMLFSSCSGLLSPADQNDRELDGIYTDAPFAEGLLLDAYVRIPSNGYSFNDVATDDAVS